MARATFSTVDRFAKRTSMTFNTPDAVLDATIQAVVDALDAVLLGSNVRGVVTQENVVDGGSAVAPLTKGASRFHKWQIQIQDTVTQVIYTHEIGTCDTAQLPSSTDDFLDLTAGVGLALLTAIEAAYESPDGNSGQVISIQEVSRTGKQ